MKEKETYKNEVLLKGKIINIYPTENGKCIIVTLDVGNRNYPKIVCWQDNADIIWEQYYVGDVITMLCNIQSSRRPNGKITTSLFCTHVQSNTFVQTPTYNHFCIKGQTVSTIIKGNTLSLLVRTDVNGHISTFPITIYNFDTRIHSFEEFQLVYVEGRIETVRKFDENGNKIYYTNYVAEQIKDY